MSLDHLRTGLYYAAYFARVEREQKTKSLRMEQLDFGFGFVALWLEHVGQQIRQGSRCFSLAQIHVNVAVRTASSST